VAVAGVEEPVGIGDGRSDPEHCHVAR
jgi:hypothetical protein